MLNKKKLLYCLQRNTL